MKRRVQKEVKCLDKDCPEGITITQSKIESIFAVTIMGPDDTAYKDGKFKLLMEIPEDYPFRPPKIKFLTPIYHPNVDIKTGKISLDILNYKWSPSITMVKACVAIQATLKESNMNISPQEALNKAAANLWRDDVESAKLKIKECVIKYANDEYNNSLPDITNDDVGMEQIDNKPVTKLICENCGCDGDVVPRSKQHKYGLLYSDTAQIEMNTFECIFCGFLLPKIINFADVKHRNDHMIIQAILKTLPLPEDVIMIISRYWLESLIGKNVYCIWSRPEYYGLKPDYLGPYLLAVKIKDIDLNQILNDNKLCITLGLIDSTIISSNTKIKFNNVKVDLLNNNGDIFNNKYDKCWVTSIVSNFVTSKYDEANYRQSVYVKTLTGKTIGIKVDVAQHTVLDLKRFIHDKEGIPPGQQRLLYGLKEMDNHRLLCDCHCYNESTIHLVLRLPGG